MNDSSSNSEEIVPVGDIVSDVVGNEGDTRAELERADSAARVGINREIGELYDRLLSLRESDLPDREEQIASTQAAIASAEDELAALESPPDTGPPAS